MNEKNMTKKEKNTLSRYKWWIICSIILLIIAYPFIFLLLNKITGLYLGELYTFGLPLEKFMTPWIAFWGVIGAVLGIVQMQRRLSIMGSQQESQQKQQEDQQIRWEKQDKQQEELRLEQKKQFEKQIEKQNDQIQIQQKQLRDTRFSSGVELLGNQNESARIGGAYNLYFLANEYPEEYLNPVCEILCAHIRTITNDKDYQEKYKKKPSNEIQTIVNLLFNKDTNEKIIFNDCTKNLSTTFLCGTNLNRKIISNAYFFDALLNSVDFSESQLKNVKFNYATFTNTTFNVSQLNNVRFSSAILYDVMFNDSNLSTVEFTNQASLSFVTFIDSILNGVVFSGKLENVQFNGAKFNNTGTDDVDFMGILTNVDFRKAHLRYVSFNGSIFNNVDFSSSLLDSTNFSGTILEKHFNEVTHKGRSLELTKSKLDIE